MRTQVLVVGGGPVGLTLAIDLGQRGIECLLVDRRPEPLFLPKMERCHPRTMEIFRRLGIADEVRAHGYPLDLPLDGFLVTSLTEQPLMHNPRPSVNEMRRMGRAVNDGTSPAEPYQVISQYTLEPLLKQIAERTPGVVVRFGCEMESFQEHRDGVTAVVHDAAGAAETIDAAYLVGCDGASSAVRRALGFQLEGDANVGEQMQALFRSDDLWDRIPIAKGEHYHVADDRWTFLIVQDDLRHFTLHSRVEDPDAMVAMFEQVVNMPVDYELLSVAPWTMRLMLSSGYASQRAFIAGDAAHLVTPIGGLGMNTGIGDAIDLSWKLAGTLQGWGGPALLGSYEPERRRIGARNVAAARRAYEARLVWRELLTQGPPGTTNREELGNVALKQQEKGSGIPGIIQGYRYFDSPIIAAEADDDGADQQRYDYLPSTRPGGRIPNVWLRDGSPIQDACSSGYTVVTCASGGAGLGELGRALTDLGCTVASLDLSAEPAAREIFGCDHLLLRPDLHVAWRGDSPPSDPVALAALVTGNA